MTQVSGATSRERSSRQQSAAVATAQYQSRLLNVTLNDPPLFRADAEDAREWVVIVTDDPTMDAPCTVLNFHDTMWLQLLATLAWDRARELSE